MTGNLMSEENNLEHPILASRQRLTWNVVTADKHPKENSGKGFAITRILCKNLLFSEKSKFFYSRLLLLFPISCGWCLPYKEKKIISGYWKRITTLLSSSVEHGSDPTDKRELFFWHHLHSCAVPSPERRQEHLQNKALFAGFPKRSRRLTSALSNSHLQWSQAISRQSPPTTEWERHQCFLLRGNTTKSCCERGCLEHYQEKLNSYLAKFPSTKKFPWFVSRVLKPLKPHMWNSWSGFRAKWLSTNEDLILF